MPSSERWTHITRNYAERCVTARIQRQKLRLQANFGLSKYKTWARAERAAKSWLRRKLPTLPTAISSKDRMTRRNTSGVVGVHPALPCYPQTSENVRIFQVGISLARLQPGRRCRLVNKQ